MSLTTGKSNAFTTVFDLIEAMSKEEGAAAGGIAPDEASVEFAPIAIKIMVIKDNLKVNFLMSYQIHDLNTSVTYMICGDGAMIID